MAQVFIEDAPPFPPMEFIEDAPMYPAMEAPQDLMPYYGPVGTEREARGFIAPFVDEFGTTQSTAYDSLESDIAAEVQARRFKGQMDFDKLVQGGATPSEALRLTAPDLFAGDPAKMARAIPKTPMAFTPRAMNVGGVDMIQRSPNEWIKASNATSPETIANRENRRRTGQIESGRIASARQDLQRAKTARDKLEKSDEGRAAASQAVAAAERALAELEGAYTAPPMTGNSMGAVPSMQPQTVVTEGPEGISMSRAPQPQQAQSPFKEGQIIRNKRDGKRYRIEKGQPVPIE